MKVRTTLVVNGEDGFLPRSWPDKETSRTFEQHTFLQVYTTMLLQICRDYPGLPDPRTLTIDEIRFFYNGLRSELKKYTS